MNFKRNVVAGVLLLTSMAAIGTGCGGIGAGGSVSPATFLLPGIGQAEPQHSSPAAAQDSEMGLAFKKSPEVAAYRGEQVR